MSRIQPPYCELLEFATTTVGKLRVDRDKGVIHGVKILGRESKNGRTYLPEAVTRAKTLYEGKAVNIDHPASGKSLDSRSVRDRFGNVRNIEERDDGLYGDLHYNPKHALAEQVAWDAENNPSNLGLSHNAVGKTTSRGGRLIVEEIRSVASVDLVADPATTRGLFEHQEQGNEHMELAEALEKVAGLQTEVATLKESVTKLTTENAALAGEKAKLQESVDAAAAAQAAAEHKTKVGELLAEHKIPEAARTKEFVALLESSSLDNATAAVKSLAGTLKGASKPAGVLSGNANISESRKGAPSDSASAGQVTDGKSLAAALRG